MARKPTAPAGRGAGTGDMRGAIAREKLIRASLRILQSKSIDAITIREVAARSKQNVSAITYYFGGKANLYRATVEHMAQIIAARLRPTLDEAERLVAEATPDRDAAIVLLKRLLRASLVLHREILGFTEIIAREQIHPTKAFDILYDGVLHELQNAGASLLATAIGGSESDHVLRIRFHALLGEALTFRYARQTIIRGAGWKDIGAAEIEEIADVIDEHVELVVLGLRAKQHR